MDDRLHARVESSLARKNAGAEPAHLEVGVWLDAARIRLHSIAEDFLEVIDHTVTRLDLNASSPLGQH